MKRWIGLLAYMFLVAGGTVSQSPAAETLVTVVGRVSYIEGELLRYVPEEDDWVAVVKDAPFGAEDALFSGSRGMAEFIAPSGAWIRIGNATQIQFIALDADISEMDVGSGVARFFNKSSDAVIKATCPFGYVLADPGTAFDLTVGDYSVEIVAVKGTVSFLHAAMAARFDVVAGSPSILADREQVSSGEGTVDPGWDRWNAMRDNFWAIKAREGARSAEYLPPGLSAEAYALEENGTWEQVPYDGTEYRFWRPTTVAAKWSPFTVGRWTDWYGDQTWIPAEPFGYVTHHYGNWIYTRNRWYWAPPVAGVHAGRPFLNVGFHWCPGRVAWVYTAGYVGWVPLAPNETYYCRRPRGGPHTVAVRTAEAARVNVNIRTYAYLNRAVVVNRDNFFRVNNYRNVRVAGVNRTVLVTNYRAAPIVNNAVIKNYTTNRRRYNYTDVQTNEKPHRTVIDRIRQNRTISRGGSGERGAAVQERVEGIPEGKADRGAGVDQPRVTNYIVPTGEPARSKSGITLQPRPQPGHLAPKGPSPPEQPVLPRPPRVAPVRPGQPGEPRQPGGAGGARPARPTQPGQSTAQPERAAPARPIQPLQPVPSGQPPAGRERTAPVRPIQPAQPAQPQGSVQPRRAAPPQPVAQPAPAVPLQPIQPEPTGQPAARPEHVSPASPGQQEQPSQPGRPGLRPGRTAPGRPGP